MEIIGKSAAMKAVVERVHKVANGRSNILIQGESGVGKDLVARAIHLDSPRREGPFIPVNCSAIPEELFESELFGHVKGAFTSAMNHKEGLFETADGGSLFLDEIAEIPLKIQGKLLRVLQERTFRRVGGAKEVKVDVRIIAATHQNLEQCVSEGRFREDLYYRLDVISIFLCPLRERPEDIAPLTCFFIKKFNQQFDKTIEGIDDEARDVLLNESWPGNVRELANAVERAVFFATGNLLTAKDFGDFKARALPLPFSSFVIPQEGLHLEQLMGQIERVLLMKALEGAQGVKTEAAKRLHLSFRSFRHRLSKYGI